MTFDLSRTILIPREVASVGAPFAQPVNAPSTEGTPSFADTLKQFVGDVGAAGQEADLQVQQILEGAGGDPHQVMLAVEEANMALEMLIEVRNKLLEAYQDLMRTQL